MLDAPTLAVPGKVVDDRSNALKIEEESRSGAEAGNAPGESFFAKPVGREPECSASRVERCRALR